MFSNTGVHVLLVVATWATYFLDLGPDSGPILLR